MERSLFIYIQSEIDYLVVLAFWIDFSWFTCRLGMLLYVQAYGDG